MTDDGLPLNGSDLSAWRIFALELFGDDSPAFHYLDILCEKFGTEYTIELDSEKWLNHIAMINFTTLTDNDKWETYKTRTEEAE